MTASDWEGLISGAIGRYLAAFPGEQSFLAAHDELVARSKIVQERFAPKEIQSVPFDELVQILRRFDNIKVAPGRILKIFSRNDEFRLRSALAEVLHGRAPIDDRLASAFGRQLGEGFFTELLCYYRPYQWPVKNTLALRGLSAVTGVYEPGYLRELTYDQFRKLLLPVAETFRALSARAFPDSEFFSYYRFLVIYRWLVSQAGPEQAA